MYAKLGIRVAVSGPVHSRPRADRDGRPSIATRAALDLQPARTAPQKRADSFTDHAEPQPRPTWQSRCAAALFSEGEDFHQALPPTKPAETLDEPGRMAFALGAVRRCRPGAGAETSSIAGSAVGRPLGIRVLMVSAVEPIAVHIGVAGTGRERCGMDSGFLRSHNVI